jgi:hypothetical protein
MAEDKKETPPQAGMITVAQASKLLMVTPQWLRQLAAKGYIPKAVKGHYPLVGAVQGYIRWLKDEERRTSKVQAESGLKAARQKEIEMRMAERARELIATEDAIAALDTLAGKVRAEFIGLPAQITRDIALRRKIEEHVHGALGRVAEALRKTAAAVETGGDALGAADEADA